MACDKKYGSGKRFPFGKLVENPKPKADEKKSPKK
jgi:hypothetical protein